MTPFRLMVASQLITLINESARVPAEAKAEFMAAMGENIAIGEGTTPRLIAAFNVVFSHLIAREK